MGSLKKRLPFFIPLPISKTTSYLVVFLCLETYITNGKRCFTKGDDEKWQMLDLMRQVFMSQKINF